MEPGGVQYHIEPLQVTMDVYHHVGTCEHFTGPQDVNITGDIAIANQAKLTALISVCQWSHCLLDERLSV